MHQDDLKNSIFNLIFDDESLYRKHYMPTLHHMGKNPKDKDRIKELVNNATMKLCKAKNIGYNMIPEEVKKELAIDLYQEMINDEIIRSR